MEIDLKTLTEKMDILKDDKARLSFELKQVEKQIEQIELQLQAILTQYDVKTMDYNGFTFGWVEKTRKTLDMKLLKEKYPQQYEDCYVAKTSERFEFKINK